MGYQIITTTYVNRSDSPYVCNMCADVPLNKTLMILTKKIEDEMGRKENNTVKNELRRSVLAEKKTANVLIFTNFI